MRFSQFRFVLFLLVVVLLGTTLAEKLTVYSGRNQAFVGPVIDAFEIATGIKVEVRYGKSSPLAALLLEEGTSSPADVFLSQDAGGLGALANVQLLKVLPDNILNRVEPRFRSQRGQWVGVTGRARVLVVSASIDKAHYPASIFNLTDAKYRGRVGWAPANSSFQSFVTAMRKIHGDTRTAGWLRGMIANDTQTYPKNTPQVDAVGRGEIDFGLVNHYYLYRFTGDNPDFPALNYYLPDADIGSLINVAGAAVLANSDHSETALRFVAFLLSHTSQLYFASVVNEYPLVKGVPVNSRLLPLDELNTPDIDLSDLSDLQGTLDLLWETGALN
jgi:iron(III) transport system substrate-binding protein